MFGNSGGDGGYGGQQHGYQTRSRGRSRHEAQEERLVEGDLFGATKRQSLRSTEPPTGLPPRAAYHDGTGSAGGNAFASGGPGGGWGGAGGYSQTPRVAQPSPFARGRTPTNAFFSAAGGHNGTAPGSSYAAPTPTNAFFSTAGGDGGGVGTAPRSSYGGARYSQVSPATGPRPQQEQEQQGVSPGMASSSEVALVPVEASGNGRGVAMDDDDDDDMPTRSLADDPDVVSDSGFSATEGIRYRRGGTGAGARGPGRVSTGGGAVVGDGAFSNAEPDTERATWVVVWGVPPGKANEVLTRFLQFGDVEEQRGHQGSNWLYLKYTTRLQAEKSLAAGHGSRLTDTVMLGVQRVPDDETWQALRAGRIPPLNAAQPVLSRATPGRAAHGDAMEVDDTDLLNAPPQRPRGDKSICSKLRAMFGFF